MVRLPEYLSKAPIGREQLSREDLSERQRDRILDTATGVFAKRGYQSTTLENIVTAAGIGVGGFYALFAGKEECFLGVYDRILAAARARIAEAVVGAEGWGQEAFLGLRELLLIFAEEPLEARIALIEAQSAGPAATARYNAVLDEVTEWLRQGREHYPEAAALPPTFEQATVAGFAFFLQQRLLSSEPQEAAALFADSTQLILELVTGSDELERLRAALAALKPA
jgi:AcrR family transcriptional regulator